MEKLFKNFNEFKTKILKNLPNEWMAKTTTLLRKTIRLVDPDGMNIWAIDISIKQSDLSYQAVFTQDYRKITIWSTKKTQDLKEISVYDMLSISWSLTVLGCFGQIADTLREEFEETIGLTTLLKIRDKYHLNDLTSGTKKQEEYFKKKWWNVNNGREKIKADPMYVDRDYKYWSAWLVCPLPEFIKETLEMIQSPLILISKKSIDGKVT